MKKEIAKLWVEALRSGKYEQGRDFLRTAHDQYCCLGVLCDLAIEAGVIDAPTRRNTTYFFDDEEASVLPERVKKWAGMRTANGRVANGRVGSSTMLAEVNDEGIPFPEIADIIEANVEAL